MHPRLSVDQLCFPGATVAEFIDHCRALGARHVVLTSPNLLADGGLDAAQRALGNDGPEVEAINHGFAVFPDLDADDGKATETLMELIAIAAELGTRSVYVVTGGRGGLDWRGAAERFCALIAPAVAAANAHGMKLMIENASGLYADIHIAHTLADTITLAERAGVGVCIELQFCWPEAGLPDLLQRVMPTCGLVQVSDYVLGDRAVPGRAVPGDGVVPLEHLVGEILELGYTGVFDIELIGPRIDAEGHFAAVKRAAERMESILTAVGG